MKLALTGVRGISAIAIFVVHSHLPAPIQSAHPLIVKLKESGWIGVPVFFVLSGYLITWLALNERAKFGTLDLGHFFARRILRIFPLYLIESPFRLMRQQLRRSGDNSTGWPALIERSISLSGAR